MKAITVFTPTYNRRTELECLYDSLKKQKSKNFEWLIVDDGSMDDTHCAVEKWIKEGTIAIRYFSQENAGKIKAYKKGVECCQTPWFICIDSDDTFTEDAMEVMIKDIVTSSNESIGFVYPQRLNGENKKWVPQHIKHMDIVDAKVLYGIKETAILCKTEYLRKVEIPSFEKEKFLSEEIIYIQLAEFGKFIPKDTRFYVSEYQEAGITRNLFRHWVANPQGTICLLNHRFCFCKRYGFTQRIWERIKCILNLNAVCMCVGLKIREHSPSKIYSALLYVPSLLWRKIRFSNC